MSLFNNLGGGDIWGSNGFLFTSPINDILEKDNFTLIDLLQEDEIIQEVKSLNTKLVDFLAQECTVRELINYIKEKPAEDSDENRRLRYPYMACEIICCETPEILETICSSPNSEMQGEGKTEGGGGEGEGKDEGEGKGPAAAAAAMGGGGGGGEAAGAAGAGAAAPAPAPGVGVGAHPFLDLLFGFLDQPEPLDHRLAGYFEKVLSTLLRHRCLALAAYLNARGPPLFAAFARHAGNYSVAQLLKRLLLPKYACVESELFFWDLDGPGSGPDPSSAGKGWCAWATWPGTLPALLGRLGGGAAGDDAAACQHVAEVFLALVEQPSLGSGLVRRLTDPQMLGALLDRTLPDPAAAAAEGPMAAAAKILRALVLRFTSPAEVVAAQPLAGLAPAPVPHEEEGEEEGEGGPLALAPRAPPEGLAAALAARVPRMCECLRSHHSDTSTTRMQTKETIPKLGLLRLELVRLLDAAMRLRDPGIDKCFEEENALELVLELFFKYEWNNTLHHAVTSIITKIIEPGGEDGGSNRAGLVKQLLLSPQCRLIERILDANDRNKEKPAGYMGHVVAIAQAVVGQCRGAPGGGGGGGGTGSGGPPPTEEKEGGGGGGAGGDAAPPDTSTAAGASDEEAGAEDSKTGGEQEKDGEEGKADQSNISRVEGLLAALGPALPGGVGARWRAYALGDLAAATALAAAPLGGFPVPSRFEENVLSTDFSEDVLQELDAEDGGGGGPDGSGGGGGGPGLNLAMGTLQRAADMQRLTLDDPDDGPLSIDDDEMESEDGVGPPSPASDENEDGPSSPISEPHWDDDEELLRAERVNDGVPEATLSPESPPLVRAGQAVAVAVPAGEGGGGGGDGDGKGGGGDAPPDPPAPGGASPPRSPLVPPRAESKDAASPLASPDPKDSSSGWGSKDAASPEEDKKAEGWADFADFDGAERGDETNLGEEEGDGAEAAAAGGGGGGGGGGGPGGGPGGAGGQHRRAASGGEVSEEEFKSGLKREDSQEAKDRFDFDKEGADEDIKQDPDIKMGL